MELWISRQSICGNGGLCVRSVHSTADPRGTGNLSVNQLAEDKPLRLVPAAQASVTNCLCTTRQACACSSVPTYSSPEHTSVQHGRLQQRRVGSAAIKGGTHSEGWVAAGWGAAKQWAGREANAEILSGHRSESKELGRITL